MFKAAVLQFDVPDMDCDSCVESITKAAKRVDPEASVTADLETKRVVIGGSGEPHAFIAAIQEAGYTVEPAA